MLAVLQRGQSPHKRRAVEAKGTENEQDEVAGLYTSLQDMNVECEGPVAAAVEDEANPLLVSQEA